MLGLMNILMSWGWKTNPLKPSVVPLLVLIALGTVLRLMLLYTTREMKLMIVDEQHYHTLALSLLHGEGFAWKPEKLTSLRPPLYPTFIAFLWQIWGGESLLLIRATQMCLSLVNVYILYRIGLVLFNARVALLAAAGLCFYPSLVAFNYFLLTEIIFTFLLSLFVLGYVTLLKAERLWVAWATGVALGCAALTRSIVWPFPLLLCPLAFWSLTGSVKRRMWIVATILLGYALVVTPWAVRNTRLQGVVTVVDTMGGLTLRMGNYEHTDLNRAWDPATLFGEKSIYQALYREHGNVSSWTEGQKEKWALRKSLIYMLDHPQITFQRMIVKFASFWGLERVVIAGWQQGFYQPPRWAAAGGTLLIPLSYMLVMVLACFGAFLSPPPDRRMHAFLVLLLGFICGIHTLTFGHERYHLPLIPFLLLYAGAAVTPETWACIRNEGQKLIGPVTASALLVLVWGREVFILEAERIRALFAVLLG
jgi:4-amino-4-deoxy-L-arabinose transferase-like glycosyltransferase